MNPQLPQQSATRRGLPLSPPLCDTESRLPNRHNRVLARVAADRTELIGNLTFETGGSLLDTEAW